MEIVRKYWTAAAFVSGGCCLALRFALYRQVAPGLSGGGLHVSLLLLGAILLSLPIIEEVRRRDYWDPRPVWAKMLSCYILSTYGFYFFVLALSFLNLPYGEEILFVRAFAGGLAFHAMCGVFVSQFVDAIFSDGYLEPLKEMAAFGGIAALCGCASGLGSGLVAVIFRIIRYAVTGV